MILAQTLKASKEKPHLIPERVHGRAEKWLAVIDTLWRHPIFARYPKQT
jgi:hypothetical protein